MPRAVLAIALLATAGCGASAEEDELSLLQTGLDQKLGNSSQPQATHILGRRLGNSSRVQLAGISPKVQSPKTFHKDFVSDGGSAGSGAAASAPSPQPPQPPQPSVAPPTAASNNFEMRAVVGEYVCMTLFVVIGCGSAMAIATEEGSAWVLQVALAFGFAITVLAYSVGRYSGGQINCAVTLALWVYGSLGWMQALFNFIAQMLGSLTGATLLCIMFPSNKDRTSNLGSNGVSDGHSFLGALLGEFLMTFLLVIVVFESGKVAGPASGIAVICIGLAVFLAHCVLIPIDGCSINPTRSFGPAVIASLRYSKATVLRDMWIFWLGPCCGALAAAGVFRLFQI